VYFVFGGFHLAGASSDAVASIISAFRQAGVEKCGATHCTGDSQIEWFKEAFAEDYEAMGVGRVIFIAK
jgi:7,8-dihydropterin-6-yl-methyl-4-(beta-D-ribofuranosyl)aminobenzene 5'-phosphate synthase